MKVHKIAVVFQKGRGEGGRSLNRNPLDFIECDLITGPIEELRGARRLMRRDRLGVLDRPTVE